jgi:NAD(P)-dependent dehydrogenase (short-subunit alcohol dehydrogenase family)
VLAFAEAVTRDLETDHIDLLFNNAGIGTLGGSFVDGDRAEWDKTFDVCWYGVYYCTRAFLPLLRKADEGHIVNTSSVNGFWASNNTAYSTAKFAVKGFTEALINDLSLNAPHIKCSVVMPGRIGTDIIANSWKVLAGNGTAVDVSAARKRFAALAWTLLPFPTIRSGHAWRNLPGGSAMTHPLALPKQQPSSLMA